MPCHIHPSCMLRLRLHKSSVIVGVLLATVMVLVLVPGRIVDGEPYGWMTIEHGWPFNYLRRQAKGTAAAPPFVMYRSRQDDVAERLMLGIPWLASSNWRLWEASAAPRFVPDGNPRWDFMARFLVCDIAITVSLLVALVAAWEIRRRRRPHFFSVSVFDLLTGTVFVSAILGWTISLAREHERERRIIDDATYNIASGWIGGDEECIAPLWMRSLFGERLLPNFTWRTTSVSVNARDVESERALAAELSQIKHLRRLEIDQRPLNRRLKLAELKCLERLQTLEFTDGFYLDEQRLDGLKQLPHLPKIVLYKDEISPEVIAQLKRELPNCRVVDFDAEW